MSASILYRSVAACVAMNLAACASMTPPKITSPDMWQSAAMTESDAVQLILGRRGECARQCGAVARRNTIEAYYVTEAQFNFRDSFDPRENIFGGTRYLRDEERGRSCRFRCPRAR